MRSGGWRLVTSRRRLGGRDEQRPNPSPDWASGLLVGVTGFEPATSSSRTTIKPFRDLRHRSVSARQSGFDIALYSPRSQSLNTVCAQNVLTKMILVDRVEHARASQASSLF